MQPHDTADRCSRWGGQGLTNKSAEMRGISQERCRRWRRRMMASVATTSGTASLAACAG